MAHAKAKKICVFPITWALSQSGPIYIIFLIYMILNKNHVKSHNKTTWDSRRKKGAIYLYCP